MFIINPAIENTLSDGVEIVDPSMPLILSPVSDICFLWFSTHPWDHYGAVGTCSYSASVAQQLCSLL